MITENGIKEQAVLLKDGLIKERDRISALISEIDSFVDEPVGESLPMELPSASQNEEPISIIGAAIAIISKHGPIKTPTLLDLLNQNGHTIQGKNPIQTLYSTLHKEAKRTTPRVERKDKLWCLIQQN